MKKELYVDKRYIFKGLVYVHIWLNPTNLEQFVVLRRYKKILVEHNYKHVTKQKSDGSFFSARQYLED